MTAAPPKAPRERPPAPRVMFASGDGRRSSNKSVDIVDMEELDLDLDFPCKLAPNCAEEEEKEGVNIRPAFFSGSDESPSFDYVGGRDEAVGGAWEIEPEDLALEGMVTAGAAADIFRGDFLGRTVAVKVYRRARAFNTMKQQVAFCREVDTLRELQHPNLVKLIGACMLASPFRLVTEFCAGGNLHELLHESGVELAWRQRHEIARDIAQAMTYLHSHDPQIIHRDLTSHNCLVASEVSGPADKVTVKVGNFGFARMRNRDEGRSSMTSDVGTLLWMAPEILRREAYDGQVDVYSFGIILYELVFRRAPFDDLDECSFQRTVSCGGRPEVQDAPGECPGDMIGLMQECWKQEPAARPLFENIAGSLSKQLEA